MTLSKPGICCDRCFDLIARRNTAAAKLWLDLCEFQTSSNIFALTNDFPHLRLLEILGFLITTDKKDIVLVKVLGRKDDYKGSFFCGGNCGKL